MSAISTQVVPNTSVTAPGISLDTDVRTIQAMFRSISNRDPKALIKLAAEGWGIPRHLAEEFWGNSLPRQLVQSSEVLGRNLAGMQDGQNPALALTCRGYFIGLLRHAAASGALDICTQVVPVPMGELPPYLHEIHGFAQVTVRAANVVYNAMDDRQVVGLCVDGLHWRLPAGIARLATYGVTQIRHPLKSLVPLTAELLQTLLVRERIDGPIHDLVRQTLSVYAAERVGIAMRLTIPVLNVGLALELAAVALDADAPARIREMQKQAALVARIVTVLLPHLESPAFELPEM